MTFFSPDTQRVKTQLRHVGCYGTERLGDANPSNTPPLVTLNELLIRHQAREHKYLSRHQLPRFVFEFPSDPPPPICLLYKMYELKS